MRQDMQALTSMTTGRWFTPKWYIDMVKEVLGFIHLDPASEPAANKIVGARQYFTETDNGLLIPWKAETIFLNPPYSKEGERKPTTPEWIDRAFDQYWVGNYQRGIILVNAKLGYNWFSRCLDHPYTTVLLHRKRIAFVDPKTMEESKNPSRQPQATIYIGKYNQEFMEVFRELGWFVS